MPDLYLVTFIHYAPKGSHGGVQCVLRAPSEDAVFAYLNALTYGAWDEDEDADDIEWSPDEPLTEAETERATSLGLKIVPESWGVTVTGRLPATVRYHRGDAFQDVEDAHYGCTQYQWAAVAGVVDDAALRVVLGGRFVRVNEAGEVSGE